MPLPAGTPRARGGRILRPQVIAGQVPSCSGEQAEGEEAEEMKSCSKSAGELVVTWPVPGGDRRRGMGEMVALPQDHGCCVGEGGRRHLVKRQSLDKAKKTKIKNSDPPKPGALPPKTSVPAALSAGGRCWPLGAARMSLGTGTLS